MLSSPQPDLFDSFRNKMSPHRSPSWSCKTSQNTTTVTTVECGLSNVNIMSADLHLEIRHHRRIRTYPGQPWNKFENVGSTLRMQKYIAISGTRPSGLIARSKRMLQVTYHPGTSQRGNGHIKTAIPLSKDMDWK